jgi:hypothetical protein
MNAVYHLNAKKAKFGFKRDSVNYNDYPIMGKFIEALKATHDQAAYKIEMVGMHNRDFRIYTDSEMVANWIRENWCN